MRSESKLTEASVKALQSSAGQQVLHWDSEVRGFGVLVGATSKSFIAQGTVNKLTRRVTIGAANGGLSVQEARSRAARVLQGMRDGIDPKIKVEPKITLQGALDRYLAKKQRSANTVASYKHMIERHLGKWLKLPITDISRDLIDKRFKSLTEDVGATSANHAMRVLKAIFSHCLDRDDPGLVKNPVRVEWNEEKRRETIIEEEQLPAWYEAVQALDSATARDYLLFVLWTGTRKMEAATLRFDQLDFEKRTITFAAADTKAKRELKLPMSDFVYQLLKARPGSGDNYVFPARGKHGFFQDANRALRTVGKTSVSVSVHDLRRTFITNAEPLMSAYALKAIVNHALPKDDVTAGYVIMGKKKDRLVAPMEAIGRELERLCGLHSAKVINLHG